LLISPLRANLPKTLAAKFVDQQCGSAMAAAQIGFMEIAQGFADITLCAGYEHMTRVAMGLANVDKGLLAPPMTLFLNPEYQHWDMMTTMNMGFTAEKLAAQAKISREEMDKWGVRSHQLASKARQEGFFKDRSADRGRAADGTPEGRHGPGGAAMPPTRAWRTLPAFKKDG
jgi:acetyl-CoA C-acetyltransferase